MCFPNSDLIILLGGILYVLCKVEFPMAFGELHVLSDGFLSLLT